MVWSTLESTERKTFLSEKVKCGMVSAPLVLVTS